MGFSTYVSEESVNVAARLALTAEVEDELCDCLGRDQKEENVKGRAAARHIIHPIRKPQHPRCLMQHRFCALTATGREAFNILEEPQSVIVLWEGACVEGGKLNLGDVKPRNSHRPAPFAPRGSTVSGKHAKNFGSSRRFPNCF